MWDFSLGWDVMAHKIVRMCRALGVPTTNGVQYFELLERPDGCWHPVRTEADHALHLKPYEDA